MRQEGGESYDKDLGNKRAAWGNCGLQTLEVRAGLTQWRKYCDQQKFLEPTFCGPGVDRWGGAVAGSFQKQELWVYIRGIL